MKGKILSISFIVGLILWAPAVSFACSQRAPFGIGAEIFLPFVFVGGAYFVLDVVESIKKGWKK